MLIRMIRSDLEAFPDIYQPQTSRHRNLCYCHIRCTIGLLHFASYLQEGGD